MKFLQQSEELKYQMVLSMNSRCLPVSWDHSFNSQSNIFSKTERSPVLQVSFVASLHTVGLSGMEDPGHSLQAGREQPVCVFFGA